MMKTTATVACLLLLLCLTCAVAQDEPISLRYKFTAGQTTDSVITGSGQLPMTITPGPEMGGGAIAMDVTLDLSMVNREACLKVDDKGAATLEISFPEMTVRNSLNVMNQPIEMLLQWKDGNLSSTVNGEAQPQDDAQKSLAAMLASKLQMVMEPSGKATPSEETAKAMSGLFNASGLQSVDMTRLSALTAGLPETPVKVGDTWKLTDTGQIGTATLTGSSELRLAAIETFENVRTARIEGSARLTTTGEMPATAAAGIPATMNITGMDIAINFVNHFDIEAGCVLVSEMAMNQNMQMMITATAPGTQAMHMPASIDNGELRMEVRRKPVAADAAKPAQ